MLSKMHKAIAVQTKLANTVTILLLYLWELGHEAQEKQGLSNGLDMLSFLLYASSYNRAGGFCSNIHDI